ncbi:MAG: GMC family oxidoreductase [Byssovorax sp.]
MSRIDGRRLPAGLDLRADVVIVGSGPAGAAAARTLAEQGAEVVVVEAGRWFEPREFRLSSFDSMADAYRDLGSSVTVGTAPAPYVQGKMVGGSSPINGAICWRMPRDVHHEWLRDDPALEDALPWDELDAITGALEARLHVQPTDPAIAGAKNQLMARGAEALGLEHRPIRRNVAACEGLGRCMQGCPKGRKLSVDATLLADAEQHGATVISSVEVTEIEIAGRKAIGVVGKSDAGERVRVRADRAVIVAASAVQSPALLLKSGLSRGPVGEGFSCHPGVSMAGRFPDPVRMWEGATQGHEVIGLRREGLKFEALGFGLGVMAGRLPGYGRAFSRELTDLAHQLDWGAAVRAEARGRVRLVAGRPVVLYQPTARDIAQYRRGLRVLGEMMLAAGADHVMPGVRGFMPRTSRLSDLIDLETHGPTLGAAYTAVITHMFGTCRMGSNPETSVVRPDFRHHEIDRLYVADSSVFPSNIGVNPQIPIMAVATLCAQSVLQSRDATTHPSSPSPISSSPVQPSRSTMPTRLTLDDLMSMKGPALHDILLRGHPLDPEILAGRQYLGVDLSLPGFARKLLWHTFRKTFTRDERTGEVRGWNVRMEQHGIDGARIPLRDRHGEPITFGHYVVRPTTGIHFPRGYRGAHYLDYGVAGNKLGDAARLGFTPLVAVNEGSQDLLLGWELMRIGPLFLPLPFYWALRYEGPLDRIIDPPGRRS